MYQRMLQCGAAAVVAIAVASVAIAGDDDSRRERDAYVVTPLTSNLAGHAVAQDVVLQNAWGIAFSPAGSPFWVNDNATGCSTLYDGTGAKITALQVSIPLPGNVVPATSCQPKDPNKPPNGNSTMMTLRADYENLPGASKDGPKVAKKETGLWFNPLIHLAAHLIRIDQEIACDETVVARHPGDRKAYAQALLKAQAAPAPVRAIQGAPAGEGKDRP